MSDYETIAADVESERRREFEEFLEKEGITEEEWRVYQDRLETERDAQMLRY